jgi:hypothetical protein
MRVSSRILGRVDELWIDEILRFPR